MSNQALSCLKWDRLRLPPGEIAALYVHIPFCFHKCHYCDFYSITRQTPERMGRFVDLALSEAELWIQGAQRVKPETIFFGGGTPTLLPEAEMVRLIEGLRARFDFSNVTEFTVEANPATISADYAAALFAAGVNRVSMGAQSFDRRELATLERHHEPDDVPRGVEILRGAGFTRLNVDLIYAVPGQTMASWMQSLECAMSLGTEHLSCYGLTYEPNTPLAVRRRLGQVKEMDGELELEMMRATRCRLSSAGIEPYEISNFAVRGCECRHNVAYWKGGDYAALGPAAASHVRGTRWRNRPHLGEWENSIAAGELAAIEVETLTARQRAGELAMLMLRLTEGIDYSFFAAKTGFDARVIFAEVMGRLDGLGLLIGSEGSIRLSESGLAVADAVAGEFLNAVGQ